MDKGRTIVLRGRTRITSPQAMPGRIQREFRHRLFTLKRMGPAFEPRNGSRRMRILHNDDAALIAGAEQVIEERRRLGLEGLTGDLEAVVISVEPDRLVPAAAEIVDRTGYALSEAFEGPEGRVVVLTRPGSADFLVRSRPAGNNPFRPFNHGPRVEHFPDTRLETFVFRCPDLTRYVDIQTRRDKRFLTPAPVDNGAFRFIQTQPSPYTGNSLGFVQWLGPEGRYFHEGCRDLSRELGPALTKPDKSWLAKIGRLDHAATRVHAEDRDAAILEFLSLTDYHFDFAVYVESLNSITNVARLNEEAFALVFTSGIEPFSADDSSGPTEQFIYNYGKRTHHLAFATEDIVETFAALKDDGLEFLVDLVGSPEEGLRQTFSRPSKQTLLVNEYIQRYNGFDGFFTKSNVTLLTKATENQ